jgi:hypothetical protein
LIGLYTARVRSGEIREDRDFYCFKDPRTSDIFNDRKDIIITELNALLREAKVPPIRGVSDWRNP